MGDLGKLERVDLVEAALLDYLERYGLTEKARLALVEPTPPL